MRLKFCQLLALLSCMVLITGCQSFLNRQNTKQSAQGVSVLHSNSAEQFSYIKQNQSAARFCTETDTDVESTASGGITLGIGNESAGDEHTQGAVTLGGRDPTVLISRELMFRACELMLNTNADAPQAVKMYIDTLESLYEIIKIHKGVGTESLALKNESAAPSAASDSDR